MKKLLTLSFLCFAITGCGSMLVKRTPELIRDAQTNIVQTVETNIVQREIWTANIVQVAPQRTNDIGQVLPPVFQLQPVQQLQSAQILLTNFIPIVTPSLWFTNLSFLLRKRV